MTIRVAINEKDGLSEVIYEERGAKTVKTMDLDALVDCLSAGAKVAGKMTALHPPGLRIHAENGKQVIVGYEFPERVVTHKARGKDDGKVTEFKTVYPWGLTWIEFEKVPNGLQWRTFYQYGLKGPVLSLDTMMFSFPGAHIYEDHRVCIGDIRVPVVKSVEATGGLPHLFYNGNNTYDLSKNRMVAWQSPEGKTIDKPADLYVYLKVDDKNPPKPFPYDCFRPGKTIKGFLEEKGYI